MAQKMYKLIDQDPQDSSKTHSQTDKDLMGSFEYLCFQKKRDILILRRLPWRKCRHQTSFISDLKIESMRWLTLQQINFDATR